MKKLKLQLNPNRTELKKRPDRKLIELRIRLTRKQNPHWKEFERRNKKIMELSKEFSQTKIAKLMELSRQRIHQIIHRQKAEQDINSKNQTP